MPVNAMLPVKESAPETAKEVLGVMLEKGVVDALLVPWQLPAGDNVAPALINEPSKLADTRVWAPVMSVNAARAVANLTVTGNRPRLGVVLRPCEIRALVELSKLEQASLNNALVIGVDCPGACTVADYAQMARRDLTLPPYGHLLHRLWCLHRRLPVRHSGDYHFPHRGRENAGCL